MGYGENKGIVPRTCKEIFERINNKKSDSNTSYEVLFGMLEIYNERLQDLLIPVEKRTPQGLKMRESKTLGFYAQD